MSDESRPEFYGLQRPATATLPQQPQQQSRPQDDGESGRRRSSSDPTGRGRQRPGLAIIRPRRGTEGSGMPAIPENVRPTSTALFHGPNGRTELDTNLADILDVIDPEVSTLNNVTNIQNSLFIPSLGRWINRRPTYQLSMAPREPSIREQTIEQEEFNFEHAVLPDGVFLEGWDDDEKAELNDYVRHMLHSRRSKFKRSMKAFGQYVSKPLGFLVTLYATLITLFGLAWVLFLIGWIYVGEEQVYAINVIDYVLVALFAVVGDGLAPFRAVDTYHMIYIAHYHRLTWKLRRKRRMGKLRDKNDLPTNADLEAARDEISVLTPEQEARLVHHQTKFAKSHTFYKPHETKTHYAFPLNWLVAIVTLLDLHSCLQISLGATTWGIDYNKRPMALTATILSCSITVNITAGILISIGGRRTRKKDVVERMFRQDLTREAFDKIREKGKKQGDTGKQLKAERALEKARKSEANDDTPTDAEIRGIPIEDNRNDDEKGIYPDVR
ncbi:uncharacterized protein GGS22DRAFT_150171 [Annulohypoxylon maeteangense]|uniref:uncharacterized protein n=1 Tax=Annulohypoxylon maeteangense TaxID=1927788 RepID=UPI00200772DC|nr:uncharacterized protein GGS22DRAFT_150171 [Annulohypoxylon maeteangense]KAI0890189.1 hypothetical protein GGS22DRAFT_150171 [Annulohypoxylon maeteangense]